MDMQCIDTPLKASLLFASNSDCYFLVVQSVTTHTTIYSGLLISKKSEMKMLKKPENLEVRTFKIGKEKKLESHIIKIQMIAEEGSDTGEFTDELRQIVEGVSEKKKGV